MNRIEKHSVETGNPRLPFIRESVRRKVYAHTVGFDILTAIRAECADKFAALKARHDTLDAIGGTLDRAERGESEHYSTAHASMRGKGKADKLTEGELSALGYNAENWKGWN